MVCVVSKLTIFGVSGSSHARLYRVLEEEAPLSKAMANVRSTWKLCSPGWNSIEALNPRRSKIKMRRGDHPQGREGVEMCFSPSAPHIIIFEQIIHPINPSHLARLAPNAWHQVSLVDHPLTK